MIKINFTTFANDLLFSSLEKDIEEIKECNHAMPLKTTRGYHVIFKNGWLISIQFGWGNYCDNYDKDVYWSGDYAESTTAEIAYWNTNEPEQPMQKFEEGDTVLGYQTVEQVYEWMNKISQLPKG